MEKNCISIRPPFLRRCSSHLHFWPVITSAKLARIGHFTLIENRMKSRSRGPTGPTPTFQTFHSRGFSPAWPATQSRRLKSWQNAREQSSILSGRRHRYSIPSFTPSLPPSPPFDRIHPHCAIRKKERILLSSFRSLLLSSSLPPSSFFHSAHSSSVSSTVVACYIYIYIFDPSVSFQPISFPFSALSSPTEWKPVQSAPYTRL